MATKPSQMIFPLTSLTNGTDTELPITPILSVYVSTIIAYINTYVLGILIGVVGVFTNTANISVYWRMGLSKTTNISFFALSIFDLLVSLSTVIVQVTTNQPVSVMRLPSGAPVSELGMGLCFIMYPCLGCSAWTTAILTIERCFCISTPLKVRLQYFFFHENKLVWVTGIRLLYISILTSNVFIRNYERESRVVFFNYLGLLKRQSWF